MRLDADEIPKELTPLKKVFMSKGKIQAYNTKREELLAAFAHNQKEYITRQEEFFCTQILANSEDFSAQWDVGYLKELKKEYDEVVGKEERFKNEFLRWVENNKENKMIMGIVLPLLMMMGIGLEIDEQGGISLVDDLSELGEDVEKMQELVEYGFVGKLEMSSGAFVEEKIDEVQKYIEEVCEAIGKREKMRSPEELVKDYLQTLEKHHVDTGTTSFEKLVTEETQEKLRRYKEVYEAKEEEIKRWKEEGEDAWRQGIEMLWIHMGQKEKGNVQRVQPEERATDEMSDEELEKYGEELKEQQEEIRVHREKHRKQKERLKRLLEQLVKEDEGGLVTEWKENNKELLNECDERIKEQELYGSKLDGYDQKLGERCEGVEEEKKRRRLEKRRARYAKMIAELTTRYHEREDRLLANDKQAIEKKNKELGKRLVRGEKVDFQKATEEIKNLEERYIAGKNDPAFKERVGREVQREYAQESIEYKLIAQGVYALDDERRGELVEEMAQWVEEGNDIKEFEIDKHKRWQREQKKYFPTLSTGPELDRLMAYRAGFKEKIEGTINHAEGINGIIALAESMIADGSFRLSVCGGLPTGEYRLGGKTYGIVDACNALSKEDYEADTEHIVEYNYHTSPLRGVAYDPKRKAIKENNISNRPSAIASKIQPIVDAGAVLMHHTGKSKHDNDFIDVCKALQTTMNVTENDALLVMMYLQGLYGTYRVSGNRGCVRLYVSDRWFGSRDFDSDGASLLLSANRLLSPDVGGASLSETIPSEDLDRITTYRTHRSSQIANTEKPKDELKQIADEMISTGEFSLVHKAGITGGRFNLGGYTKCFGSSDHHWKDKSVDPDDILEEVEYNNKVLSTGTRYLPKFKALQSNDIDKRKEPVRSQMKTREAAGISYDHAGELEKLIDIIMQEKGVNKADALAIYMYLTGQYGSYRTGQWGNGCRGGVGLYDSHRGFGSLDHDFNFASLLLSW